MITRASAAAETSNHTNRWLLVLFLAIVAEGGLRKWVLPSSLQPVAFIAKDVVAFAFILAHPLGRHFKMLRRIREIFFIVALLLLPAFVLGAIQEWQGAIIIYKNAFLWGILAVHLAPRLDSRVLACCCRWLVYITIGMAFLGFLQYGSGADSFVNRYAWSSSDAKTQVIGFAAQAGGVRATGTFSFISGMSTFATFAFAICLWRFARGVTGKEYWLTIAGMLAAICCGLTSGSRSTSVIFVLTICMTLLFSDRVKPILHLVVLGVCACLFFTYLFDQQILASFAERWTLKDGQDYGIGRATGEGLKGNYVEIVSLHPWGIGLGRQSGLAAFRADEGGSDLTLYDDGATRGIVEAGALGLLAQLTIQLTAIVIFVRGLFSNLYQQRLRAAAVGVLAAYSLCLCSWHDHNSMAMGGLLLAIWLSSDASPIKRTIPRRPRFALSETSEREQARSLLA